MACLMVFWLVPALACSRTPAMLLATWVVGEIWYQRTGDGMPIGLFVTVDFIAAMLIWANRRGRMDWGVLAIFPILCVVYASDLSAYDQYWSLWWLTVIQMILAGPWLLLAPLSYRERYTGTRKTRGGFLYYIGVRS